MSDALKNAFPAIIALVGTIIAVFVGYRQWKRQQETTRTSDLRSSLRIYKEVMPMRKENVDLANAVVWIPDSKTPNGIAEVPLTLVAIQTFQGQIAISGDGPFLFPSERNSTGHHKNLRRTWQRTLARAKVPYFRIYDLRSTYATRLSAGGVADEWVMQMLRQGDAQVFKKYSQMKLQMKREALEKLNRQASEMPVQGTPGLCTAMLQ